MDYDFLFAIICMNSVIALSTLMSPRSSASPPVPPLPSVHSPTPSPGSPCDVEPQVVHPPEAPVREDPDLFAPSSTCQLRLGSLHLQLYQRPSDLRLPLGLSSHHFCHRLASRPLQPSTPMAATGSSLQFSLAPWVIWLHLERWSPQISTRSRSGEFIGSPSAAMDPSV